MDDRRVDEDRLWKEVANLSTAVAEDQPGEEGVGSGNSGMTFEEQWDQTIRVFAEVTRQRMAEFYGIEVRGGREAETNLPPEKAPMERMSKPSDTTEG